MRDRQRPVAVERFVRTQRHHQAVNARRPLPRNLEEVVPLLRIGDVVAIGVAVRGEIIWRADNHAAFRIGEALKLYADRLANRAARSVGPDEIACLMALLPAIGRFDHDLHRVVALPATDDLGRGPKRDV